MPRGSLKFAKPKKIRKAGPKVRSGIGTASTYSKPKRRASSRRSMRVAAE